VSKPTRKQLLKHWDGMFKDGLGACKKCEAIRALIEPNAPIGLELAMRKLDDAIDDAYTHRQSITTQKGYTTAEARADAEADRSSLAAIKDALKKRPPPTTRELCDMVTLLEYIIQCDMCGYFGNGQADEQDAAILKEVNLIKKIISIIGEGE
jgi:hypothetical protein